MTNVERVLLTTEEAATYLNSTRRTLERWRTERYGPAYVKSGHRVHYRREALDEWITRQERTHTNSDAA